MLITILQQIRGHMIPGFLKMQAMQELFGLKKDIIWDQILFAYSLPQI